MKIVNCALLYADGDKYVWSVVTEGASEFPIDMELVADGSIWENDGTKSVLTDGSWVAESSGGGVSFPTFTRADESWTCDMTYDEAKAVLDNEGYDQRCPCLFDYVTYKTWYIMEYLTKAEIEALGTSYTPALPDDLVGGLRLKSDDVFGSDGTYYIAGNK